MSQRSDRAYYAANRDRVLARQKAQRQTRAPEYSVWTRMNFRCSNPDASDYKYYGGRGITVCQRWRDSFAVFLEDVGRRPSSKHTIDRIDNDGNYEPGNVRWATKSEQQRNKRPLRVTCSCGTCPKCKHREYVRARRRAA